MITDIDITAIVHPTEPKGKVMGAILNLFPDAEMTCEEGSEIRAKAKELETFKTLLKDQRIRDTARTVLGNSMNPEGLRFHLNKQAAFVGKVNFTEGDSLLGDIEISIKTEDAEGLILSLVEEEL